MPLANFKIYTYTGASIKTYLSSIARLRIEVFRDFPYLHEDDMQSENQYLKKYTTCKEAIAVLVFDNSEIVGVSTGIPLEYETKEFQQLFIDHGLNPRDFFYFSESVLLKKYRGRGLGHHFFDLRETHVYNLKRFKHICFCCVARPQNHPLKAPDYVPLDDFWTKRGYVKHPDMIYEHPWKDIGEDIETLKPMIFWIKDLQQHSYSK